MNQRYEQIILEGIKGLSANTLIEIADFVYFVRKRTLQPQEFIADLAMINIGVEGRVMSQFEQQHLEEEFADYEQLYPLE